MLARPRTATVRAVTQCDMFVLARDELEKVLAEHPRFAEQLHATARERYGG